MFSTLANNQILFKIIVGLLFFVYLFLLLKTGWLSDDAYITFRTIDNFVNGYGLRWNIAERVQSYTHPLWMFLLSAIYFFIREIFFTAILTSIIISVSTVYILSFKITRSYQNMFIILFAIIFSKAFIDYSTSGLENPLTNLLLVLFGHVYIYKETGRTKVFLLSLLSSLIMVNRMDCVLLILPALIFELVKSKKHTYYLIALAGFTPFILWEIFSIFYYGFPFPNTAYAKLNTGIARIELISQGLKYFTASIEIDYLTLPVIFAGIIISLIKQNKEHLLLTLGVVLYLIYIIWIGGDFMNGRFIVAPFVLSLIILGSITFSSLPLFIIAYLLLPILGLISPNPTILPDPGIRHSLFINEAGICDERLFYKLHTSLFLKLKGKNIPNHPWIDKADSVRIRNSKFEIASNIGFFGFYAGRDCHILDDLALSDPLLARLPAKTDWRIGNFHRDVPAGYEETLISGENKIVDKGLSEFYDKLALITRGDLLDTKRLITIWKINTKQYDHPLENCLSPINLNNQ